MQVAGQDSIAAKATVEILEQGIERSRHVGVAVRRLLQRLVHSLDQLSLPGQIGFAELPVVDLMMQRLAHKTGQAPSRFLDAGIPRDLKSVRQAFQKRSGIVEKALEAKNQAGPAPRVAFSQQVVLDPQQQRLFRAKTVACLERHRHFDRISVDQAVVIPPADPPGYIVPQRKQAAHSGILDASDGLAVQVAQQNVAQPLPVRLDEVAGPPGFRQQPGVVPAGAE